ncbi:MAG: ABC transporter ATP-binding protein [Pseudodesulfovibrio sp.]
MLLDLSGVSKDFVSGWFGRRRLTAVSGVSLRLDRGETVAVIGESGSGKSTLGRLALGLLRPTRGRVLFAGQDPARPACGQRNLRKRLQAVFQDADGTLNPRLTARELLLEPLAVHGLLPARPEQTLGALLGMVHLTPDVLARHPFELSGGQRQRIGLARAMSLDPELLVADEPTASLDPSVQARILDILRTLKEERGLACLYISHELHTVRFVADRAVVLYAGHAVEEGGAADVLDAPAHPYTRELVAAARGCPGPGHAPAAPAGPSAARGCPFAADCPEAGAPCLRNMPELRTLTPTHRAACHALA